MMGTKALANSNRSKAQRAPLASHPYFTPLIMVWFAALLGLSILAIEGAMLERWVLAMKIDEILPAAAPPLGAKARLLAALAMGIVGAGLGWVVARLMRPAPLADGEEFQLRQRDRHPDAPARRPISAHEELGDEGLGRASSHWDDMSTSRAEPKNYEPHLPEPRDNDVFAAPFFIPPLRPSETPLHEAEPAPLAAQPSTFAEQDDDAELLDLSMIDLRDQADAAPAPKVAPSDEADENAKTMDTQTPSAVETAEDAFDEGWHALPPVVSDSDLPPAKGARPAIPSILPKIGAVPLRAVEPAAPTKAPAKPASETPALIGATPVHPRASAGERLNHAALGELSHVELIERLAMAIHSREKKSVPPVAVNDLLDPASPMDEEGQDGEHGAPQASLRSALANLREVK